jgi:hypothetical protein
VKRTSKPRDCCQHFTQRRYEGTLAGKPVYAVWCSACGRSPVSEGTVLAVDFKRIRLSKLSQARKDLLFSRKPKKKGRKP